MKKIYYLLVLLLLPFWSIGQVTTDPAFVVHDQPVTIYYDATQGVSGLQGAAKVYMHAGVITAASTSNSDWKYVKGNWGKDDGLGLMEKVAGEENLWKITLSSPREYFGVPDSETILKIGMVFRNADGTQTGKDDQNGDIFVNVYKGFALSIVTPENNTILASAGEQITIQATASETADFTVSSNGQILYTQANTTSISYAYTFSGNNETENIIVSATNGTDTASDELEIIRRVFSPTATMPQGLQQGLNKTADDAATFILLAPGKSSVYLVGDFTNWQVDPNYLMKRDGELFWLELSGLDPDTEYAYYYWVDQTIDIADPYSELVLDKGEDKHINNTRYPGLRSFPIAAQTDRLSVFQLNEAAYQWQATNYTRPEKQDLIIYELLIRDFSAAESIQGVIDQLDYLDSLHITAIQLMPVMEFNGNNSWGYNPTFMLALDKWYGTKEKLKELIDKAHQRNIAVILDITLNHQDYPNPFLKMWWAGSTASADNPFFNVTPTHPYNVFTDMNHESPYTKSYMDRITRYWLEEYKVDGFRFDLSKGFTQVQNPDNVGAWGAYDASRVAILKRMADKIWAVDQNAYVILEHFAENAEEKELAAYGMLLWGNLNHNYSQAAMGYDLSTGGSNFNWLSHKARGWEAPNLVGYMESHDEERMMYRLLEYGNAIGNYSTKELTTAIDRVKLAAAFFIPVPGPKMLWQFGELGYDISIEQNGRTGKKPLKWEYLQDPHRQDLFRTFSALNALKTEYQVFETEDFEMPGTSEIRTLKLNSTDMNVVIVGNFGLSTKNASVSFQHSGWWYSYFQKDSVQAGNSAYSLSLDPGEFRIFFDQPVFYTGVMTPLGIEDAIFARQISLFPNPVSGSLLVNVGHKNEETIQYKVMDTAGRQLLAGQWQQTRQKTHMLTTEDLNAGLYLLQIQQGNYVAVKRFIKQ